MISKENDTPKEKVPLLGSWNAWYIVVLAVLAVLIFFFNWLTKFFS